MSRVNFYQLLDLKINPPESDATVIEAAIKRKQAEWSRLRNHPTKGTEARQSISLLNEIRRVMADERLREQEARQALELLKKKLEAKFTVIDSQVHLLGAKGDLSENDIERLAHFHKVRPQIIQRRVDRWRKNQGHPLKAHLRRLLIHAKPDEKSMAKIATQFNAGPEDVQRIVDELIQERSTDLDSYINIQIRKGYLSEKEIVGLSEVYGIDQGDILRRIRCPIRKESEVENESHQLDSTVEQFINDNLRIVEQDSLYSFLGLFPGSPLEALQKKAVEKEKEIRKISQKDAFLTASGVLVGQCISIFKSDESRYAYDISRARSLLKNLNQDIGLAVERDVIGLEQYSHLLRKAVSFGTPPDKARQHILDYCRSKNWRVETPKRKLNVKRYARVAAVTLSISVLALAVFWYFYFSQQRLQAAFTRSQQEALAQPVLEDQIRILEDFLAQHDDEDLRERAAGQITSLRNRIVQRDFQQVTEAAAGLYADQRYEAVDALFREFLQRHGDSDWAAKIRPKLAELPKQIDQRDYQNLAAMPMDDPEAIAHAGIAYLRQHPDGAFVQQARQLIEGVATPYYRNVVAALDQCEQGADWPQCIRLASRYIHVYGDSTSALKLRERRDRYQIELQNKTILDALVAKAGGPDADPAARRSIFQAFLQESSNSPAAPVVRRALEKIGRQLGRQEAQQELDRLRQLYARKSGRFTIHKQDMVRDEKTGLTWALLDSRYLMGHCVTYQEALQHVKTMELGGYSDWRLPRAQEIVRLYAAPTSFQGATSNGYWSSDSFKRYAGGWVELVDVVHPSPQPRIQKTDAQTCGWFRAVRP